MLDILFADIDDCDPNLCENGATCTDLVDDYNCTCSANEEFFGDNCESKDYILILCRYSMAW